MTQMLSRQSVQFPVQVKIISREETREYRLKKDYEISLKSEVEAPQLELPNEERIQWVERKMTGEFI